MTQSSSPEDAGFAHDCLIVGAGIAGLACARRLAQAGLRVCVVEARESVGGRIMTAQAGGQRIELGAEFVHGRPPELLALIREAGLHLTERTGSQVSFSDGRLTAEDDARQESMFAPLEHLCSFSGPDLSFRDYLAQHPSGSPEAHSAAIGYVEGFNAADAGIISARALGLQQAAEDATEGDRSAHVAEGYVRLPEFVAADLRRRGTLVRCGVIVRAVHWSVGRVALQTSAGELVAPRAVLTLPLGVLQARSVAIVPEPLAVLAAAAQMRMGEVCRFSLVFRRPFWDELPPQPAMRDLSFLFSFDRMPPVWWTSHPERSPVLTGWAGGPRSAALRDLSEEQLAAHGIRELSRILGFAEDRLRAELLACRSHNWSADPFSRGSYSYVAVDGADASEQMSYPVEHTLFFAGEHTDTTGHWGTTHGALRSGLRAAEQVLAAAGRT